MDINIFYNILFVLVSAISVFSYYGIANKAGWTQRSVTDIQTAYWNSFQAIVWSFAILFMRETPATLWSILPILPTTLIYGLIGENKDFQFDLSSKLSTPAIIVLSAIGLILLCYLGVVVYYRSYFDILSNVYFFLPAVVFISWILTWFSFMKADVSTTTQEFPGYMDHKTKSYIYGGTDTETITTTRSLHIHHWMIAILGMLLTKDRLIISELLSGVFWGVFCQEIAAYGIDLPLDSHQTDTSSYTQNLLNKTKN